MRLRIGFSTSWRNGTCSEADWVVGKQGKMTAKGKGPDRGCEGVWVWGDIRTEAMKKATESLLAVASGIARKRGAPLSLVLLGRHLETHLESFRNCPADMVYFI